jgi:protein tyrosine/serine phosphatase
MIGINLNDISDSKMWYFKKLHGYEKIQGTLLRKINDIIINRSIYNFKESDGNLICPHVWLGNYHIAHDFNFVTGHKIDHIINMTGNISNIFPFIDYTQHPIRDNDINNVNIYDIMDSCANIIHNVVSSGHNILVHCKQGHHRSAAMIVFYLMKYHNMDLVNALCYVKNRRPTSFRKITKILKYLMNYDSQQLIYK